MKKQIYRFTIWVSLAICGAGLCTPAVLAATANNAPGSGQALEIAPPVITLSADPGQTIKTQLSLRDISSGNLVVTNQVNDFVAAGEDGTPKLLFEDAASNPYSMKAWLKPIPQLLMVPHQIQALPITIVVPANAAPGGHYGVIRFTAAPPELHGTGVSLSTSLGALFESTPLQFLLRLKNSGNVHEQPVGRIIITDMFGKDVASVNVNLPPRNVLPASIRRFEGSLDTSDLGTKKLFGRYHANLTVTYGASKQTLESSLAFWVIPYRLIGIAIVAIVIAFFALRFLIRRYNRRVIRRYTTRR
jgi:hypothetical protein